MQPLTAEAVNFKLMSLFCCVFQIHVETGRHLFTEFTILAQDFLM